MKMNNKGFTLVEVMAGFSLLVVLMVSFVKIIKISSELTTASVDAKNKTMGFYERYYSGENYYNSTDKNKRKEAFRLPDDAYCVIRNQVTLTEVTPDYENSIEQFTMNNVKLKKIENIYDYTISRISVYRFVRDK